TPTPCARGCRSSSPSACAERSDREQLLHHDRVHPLAVELSLLAVDADRAEAGLRVESHAGSVAGKRRQHELVLAVRAAELGQLLEQHASDALAAPAALDVHGDVRYEAIGLARVEHVEARPAHGP